MRPEDLQVNLRPRSSWEAMELGTALLRRHAGAVWRPWLLALLPLFAALNALAWALGQPWLAWLALWWLKPALERIVLYVLSRAVFGQAPGTLAALRAQWRFAARRFAFVQDEVVERWNEEMAARKLAFRIEDTADHAVHRDLPLEKFRRFFGRLRCFGNEQFDCPPGDLGDQRKLLPRVDASDDGRNLYPLAV